MPGLGGDLWGWSPARRVEHDPLQPLRDLWHHAGSDAAASVSPLVSKSAPLPKLEHPQRGLQGAMPQEMPPCSQAPSAARFLQQEGHERGPPTLLPPWAMPP